MSERSIKRQQAREERRRDRRLSRRAKVAAGLAAGAAVLAAPAAAEAATFTVFSLTDGPPGACDASCTLREAIDAANTNAGVADTIVFDSTVTGSTYTLTQGQLEITDPAGVSIGTPENGLTIDAEGNSRVLYVTGAASMSDVQITDGFYAGGSRSRTSGPAPWSTAPTPTSRSTTQSSRATSTSTAAAASQS
jgi:CSLREA domain-containing protein